jgi:hypothetical protein
MLSVTVRAAEDDQTYSEQDIVALASEFFGDTAEGLGTVIEKVFAELGRPNGYITGEELSGAVGFGLRYGRGELTSKTAGGGEVYWTGPSLGFDVGGNASKVFVLVYNLRRYGELFQRFPAVDGSFYYVAGVGANYQSVGDITLAPVRAGVGLRAGASIGYMHYTRERSWMPF